MVWPLDVRSICARPWSGSFSVSYSAAAAAASRRARRRTFLNKPLTASMVVAVTLSPHAANKSFWSISCRVHRLTRSQRAWPARLGFTEMAIFEMGKCTYATLDCESGIEEFELDGGELFGAGCGRACVRGRRPRRHRGSGELAMRSASPAEPRGR